MLSGIKKQIKELAKNAVLVAESEFGPGKGTEKKKRATDYVVKNLPFPNFVKNIISLVLSKFIDDIIEVSLHYVKSLPKTEGE